MATVRVIINGEVATFDPEPVIKNGTTLLPAHDLLSILGGCTVFDEGNGEIRMDAHGHLILMRIASKTAYVDGKTTFAPEAPILSLKKKPLVPARFVAESLGARVEWNNGIGLMIVMMPERGVAGKLFLIDPGHGGGDSGAVGPSGLLEKDVNLDVARRLAQLINLTGGRVQLTRKEDIYISLRERVRISNALAGTSCFISIHCNSHRNPKASGTETYYYQSEPGRLLASEIQKGLVSTLSRIDRGVKEAAFYVLKHTIAPAALAELAFISNPEEANLLSDAWFREMAALGVYTGLREGNMPLYKTW